MRITEARYLAAQQEQERQTRPNQPSMRSGASGHVDELFSPPINAQVSWRRGR